MCQSNVTALLGEAHSLIQAASAIPQSRRAILTALYGDTALLRPPFWGAPPPLLCSLKGVLTALYRDTALLRPPCWDGAPLILSVCMYLTKNAHLIQRVKCQRSSANVHRFGSDARDPAHARRHLKLVREVQR